MIELRTMIVTPLKQLCRVFYSYDKQPVPIVLQTIGSSKSKQRLSDLSCNLLNSRIRVSYLFL